MVRNSGYIFLCCILLGVGGLYIANGLLSPSQKLSLYLKVQKPWCRIRADKPNSYLDDARLKRKIDAGPPAWAFAQINQDLSAFPKISQAALDRAFEENQSPNNQLVRFQIRKGVVHSIVPKPPSTVGSAQPYQIIYHLLTKLAKDGYLPDTDFIMSFQDYVQVTSQHSVPIFTFAKDQSLAKERDLILVPDYMNLRSVSALMPRIRLANRLFPWAQKKPLVLWRGGPFDSSGFREKLVAMSAIDPQWIDAAFAQNNPATYRTETDHVAYRYQISIDGLRATWERLVWQLYTNCLVFKHQSPHMQWFYGADQYACTMAFIAANKIQAPVDSV